jgi:AraC-like DNA-binding protein
VATDIPGLTTVVVADPREANRLIWERLRPGDRGLLNEREACSREYDVLDRRRILIEPESFHSEFSFASIGAMRASRVFDARATQVTVRTAGLDAYGFVLMERGASELVTPRSGERTVGNCEIGTSFDGLTIADIAHAAGCSVRALQTAFQRFRATTPMTGLRRIRLAHARIEMLRNDRVESVARIAAGHGFSNPSRFAQLFRRTYGPYPSEVVPLWRDVPGEKRDRNPSTDRNLPRPGMGRTPSSDPP